MDLTYATIPVFGGEHRRLYREAQLAYNISDEANPTNNPIFSLDTNLGSSLIQPTEASEPPLEIKKKYLILFVKIPLLSPLCGKCSSMEPLLRKVLVLEWFLFHLLKKL
jgi:hypothetical protein